MNHWQRLIERKYVPPEKTEGMLHLLAVMKMIGESPSHDPTAFVVRLLQAFSELCQAQIVGQNDSKLYG